MADEAPRRSVEIRRESLGRYTVRSARGVELTFGHGDDLLSPVELLLAAIAGCSAIDVDYVASKRAEPEDFTVAVSGAPHTDENGGHRLVDLAADFHVTFPDTDAGRAAQAVVERTVAQSRDRLCTVSRTVAAESPVAFSVDGTPVP